MDQKAGEGCKDVAIANEPLPFDVHSIKPSLLEFEQRTCVSTSDEALDGCFKNRLICSPKCLCTPTKLPCLSVFETTIKLSVPVTFVTPCVYIRDADDTPYRIGADDNHVYGNIVAPSAAINIYREQATAHNDADLEEQEEQWSSWEVREPTALECSARSYEAMCLDEKKTKG
jgi:hypothetical protein